MDTSVAVSWFFDDERTERSAELLMLTATGGALVPSLWHLEVANVLQMSVRRGRMKAEDRESSLGKLRMLNIEVDRETVARAWSSTLRLADREKLTVYDAAYLELADRMGLPLATLDQALARAAVDVGVRLA